MKLKFIFSQGHYFFRGGLLGGVGFWVGGVEEMRIKPSQLSTKLMLKLSLTIIIVLGLHCILPHFTEGQGGRSQGETLNGN